jgi:hypothetical protein
VKLFWPFFYLILWDGNCGFCIYEALLIVLNIGGGDSFAARFGSSNDVCSPAHSSWSGPAGIKLETCTPIVNAHEWKVCVCIYKKTDYNALLSILLIEVKAFGSISQSEVCFELCLKHEVSSVPYANQEFVALAGTPHFLRVD